MIQQNINKTHKITAAASNKIKIIYNFLKLLFKIKNIYVKQILQLAKKTICGNKSVKVFDKLKFW